MPIWLEQVVLIQGNAESRPSSDLDKLAGVQVKMEIHMAEELKSCYKGNAPRLRSEVSIRLVVLVQTDL
jgi:hypothetical protein